MAYVQIQFETKGKSNLQITLVKYKYIELHARGGVYTNLNRAKLKFRFVYKGSQQKERDASAFRVWS